MDDNDMVNLRATSNPQTCSAFQKCEPNIRHIASERVNDGYFNGLIEFAVLTSARSREVRDACWSEFDLGIRRILAEEMKLKKEHRVPLPQTLIDLLREIFQSQKHDRSGLVFPSPRGNMLSDMTLLAVIKRMIGESNPPIWRYPLQNNAPVVSHGFGSTFRDWTTETTSHQRELIEVALTHAPGDQSEMAYGRGDMLERRRQIMEDWAQLAGREFQSASVIPMQRQAAG